MYWNIVLPQKAAWLAKLARALFSPISITVHFPGKALKLVSQRVMENKKQNSPKPDF